jgi:hypothetical protein
MMPSNADVLDAISAMQDAAGELTEVPSKVLMAAYVFAELFKAGELVEMAFGKPAAPAAMSELGNEINAFAVDMQKTIKVSNKEPYSNEKRLKKAKDSLKSWKTSAVSNAKAVKHLTNAEDILKK